VNFVTIICVNEAIFHKTNLNYFGDFLDISLAITITVVESGMMIVAISPKSWAMRTNMEIF
jgi:hypothetical protein